MRHQIKGKKLNRTASHRKATLRSLSIALIKNERIVTTTTKAKELRRFIEPLITRAKDDTTHNRREVFSFLHDNESTSKLFNEIAPKCATRPGGYTRVIKLGTRQGDGAEVAVIELVDYNDVRPDNTGSKKKRTRRGGTKAAKPAAAAPAAAETIVEKVADKASEVVEEVKETVSEAVENVSETVEDVVEAVEDKVEEISGSADEATDEDADDSEEKKEA